MSDDLRAYRISAYGIDQYWAATSRPRAQIQVARMLHEYGYARTVGAALKSMRAVRAPEADLAALSRGRDGALSYP